MIYAEGTPEYREYCEYVAERQKRIPRYAVLPQRLKQLRDERGLTKPQLGEKLGINWHTLANYEATSMPPVDRLVKLCEFYNVTPDYLLGFTDERRKVHVAED